MNYENLAICDNKEEFEKNRREFFDIIFKSHMKTKINKKCFHILYEKISETKCVQNIPKNIQTIIFRKFVYTKNTNIRANVKKIIFITENASKSIKKIPYGCEIDVYEYSMCHYNSFDEFLIKTKNNHGQNSFYEFLRKSKKYCII
jgi:hypothetical protein